MSLLAAKVSLLVFVWCETLGWYTSWEAFWICRQLCTTTAKWGMAATLLAQREWSPAISELCTSNCWNRNPEKLKQSSLLSKTKWTKSENFKFSWSDESLIQMKLFSTYAKNNQTNQKLSGYHKNINPFVSVTQITPPRSIPLYSRFQNKTPFLKTHNLNFGSH